MSFYAAIADRIAADSWVSRDFADRTSEEAAVASLIEFGLPPTTPEEFEVGPAEPGPDAMKVENMEP